MLRTYFFSELREYKSKEAPYTVRVTSKKFCDDYNRVSVQRKSEQYLDLIRWRQFQVIKKIPGGPGIFYDQVGFS